MVSGVMNGDPLQVLQFRQHDWGGHHQGPALVPGGVAKLDLDVAGDQVLRLDVARDQKAGLGCKDVQVTESLKVIPGKVKLPDLKTIDQIIN